MQSLLAVRQPWHRRPERQRRHLEQHRLLLHPRQRRQRRLRPGRQFSLSVQENAGTCAGVAPSTTRRCSPSPVPAPRYQTLILDQHEPDDRRRRARDDGDEPEHIRRRCRRSTARSSTSDRSARRSARSRRRRTATPDCPYAENLVAERDPRRRRSPTAPPIPRCKYIVIVGDDHVIPFFRYPDTAGIGPESDYIPPVLDTSASYGSLASNDVLSQDAYGANDGAPSQGRRPAGARPAGRAAGRDADARSTACSTPTSSTAPAASSPTPTSSLVTGYDFMTSGADAVESELQAGLGRARPTTR